MVTPIAARGRAEQHTQHALAADEEAVGSEAAVACERATDEVLQAVGTETGHQGPDHDRVAVEEPLVDRPRGDRRCHHEHPEQDNPARCRTDHQGTAAISAREAGAERSTHLQLEGHEEPRAGHEQQ